MHKHDVRSTDAALAYLTDCTLATVTSLASKKSGSKYETRRHIAMAQQAIDWMREFGVDYTATRAKEVVAQYGGNVERWADQFRP